MRTVVYFNLATFCNRICMESSPDARVSAHKIIVSPRSLQWQCSKQSSTSRQASSTVATQIQETHPRMNYFFCLLTGWPGWGNCGNTHCPHHWDCTLLPWPSANLSWYLHNKHHTLLYSLLEHDAHCMNWFNSQCRLWPRFKLESDAQSTIQQGSPSRAPLDGAWCMLTITSQRLIPSAGLHRWVQDATVRVICSIELEARSRSIRPP